jgi:hypothetical protein
MRSSQNLDCTNDSCNSRTQLLCPHLQLTPPTQMDLALGYQAFLGLLEQRLESILRVAGILFPLYSHLRRTQ